MASADEVVEAAAAAAEESIFEAYAQSGVSDVDVTVHFQDAELTIDVYLDANAETPEEQEREAAVVDEAVTAAQEAVDTLLEE